ncbi:porphobilinogen deaminase, dipyromethane cofactor binding domain-domain-containing protein [Naematelia encephala]|uniref:Porphobilinogen deaminase n=1 Tax=Naematelia encephala TaxID=71784 RepID=A0A1Y2AKW6_9TREE|nr:porphobilinogen deaminase, dipyromethane cofactor binding domain-domain-containing protein [Naematelia encephala]
MSTPSCPHTTNSTASSRHPLPHSYSTMAATPSGTVTPFDIDSVFTSTSRFPFESPSLRPSTSFVLGTRKSQLALTQTHIVSDALGSLHDSCTFSVESMTTVGDKNQTTPLHLLTPYSQQQPAKSLWTDELEARLTSGHFDMLVHSLKDVPTTLKGGCEIGAMLEREDPRDCLVVKEGRTEMRLEDLADGSVVGTGSIRRVAQLKRAFPALKFEDMRGNLNTRLGKLDNPSSTFAALILATSGLARIGLSHRITSPISSPELYHAVGQGALGVEIRSNDPRVREALRGVGHWQTEWRCAAERGCLRVLEGGCSVPVGVETELEELDPSEHLDGLWSTQDFDPITSSSPMLHFSGILPWTTPLPTPHSAEVPVVQVRRARLTLRVCVTSLDGSSQVVCGPPPVIVGNYQQAERFGEMIAGQVKDMGGKAILDEVAQVRRERERRDLERAIDKSRQEAERLQALSGSTGAEEGTARETSEQDGDVHQGLQGLMKLLTSPPEPRNRDLDS